MTDRPDRADPANPPDRKPRDPHIANPDDALAGIQAFAADQAAELDGLGDLLAALRASVDDTDVAIDTDAVWRRVLDRLDHPSAPAVPS